VGAATAAGTQANVSQQIVFAATVGNASAAGIAAQVSQATTIACTPASGVANGIQATISQAITLACGVGNAQADGVVASVSQAITLAATVGDAEAEGTPATVSLAGGAIDILCGVGDAVAQGITAGVTVTGSAMTGLDSILALLRGRKVLDEATNTWRVYDAGGVELADPGGVLWRGVHGALLQAAMCCCKAAEFEPATGGQTRAWRKPVRKPIRRREEDEALMMTVLNGL
jgi:hypothetical protein